MPVYQKEGMVAQLKEKRARNMPASGESKHNHAAVREVKRLHTLRERHLVDPSHVPARWQLHRQDKGKETYEQGSTFI